MIARSQLAVLDFNAGAEVVHAETKDERKKHKLQFSKVTQTWVVKRVYEGKEKSYIQHLLNEISDVKAVKQVTLPSLKNVPVNIAP